MGHDLNFWHSMSDRALLGVLGEFIQKTRLKQNKTQQEIAEIAGINRSTLVQIEKGNGSTLLSFIQILRALEKLDVLNEFEMKMELSPLKLAEMEMNQRKRASKSVKLKNKPQSSW